MTDPVTFVMEKPIRAAILAALEDVSFLSPGRYFKTIVVAMQIAQWSKTYPEEIDIPAAVANLGQLHKLGLVKKTRRHNGKRVFVKGRWIEQRTSYWRLTNDGIKVLGAVRWIIEDRERGHYPDLLERGSGDAAGDPDQLRGLPEGSGRPGDDSAGQGRPVAVPEGSSGDVESTQPDLPGIDAAEEDQRGHEDDAGRPGSGLEADEPWDDPDRYDYGYRHRHGDT